MEDECQEVGPTIWFCQQLESQHQETIERLELEDYPTKLMLGCPFGMSTPNDKFQRYPGYIYLRMVRHLAGDRIFTQLRGIESPPRPSLVQYGWKWQFLKNLNYNSHEGGQAISDQEIMAVIIMCGFIPKETAHA